MASHSRKPSSKAALARRTTKGPLNEDELLSLSSSLANPPLRSPETSPLSTSPRTANIERRNRQTSPPSTPLATADEPPTNDKDFSFLLEASIYHPLSQLEVPTSFRRPFPPAPSPNTTTAESLAHLETLLSQCDYLGGAYLAGSVLTSGTVRPNDIRTIFRLLAIRYSCLELSGNILLAAQEAKALEDLSSAFYYDEIPPQDPSIQIADEERPLPRHLMPFSLRLHALRLQSIGFSDPRRGVSALYDLGLECRERVTSAKVVNEDRKVWAARLDEIGMRVVNSLIEMGDLDCARRTLTSMMPPTGTNASIWAFRMTVLHIKMGLLWHAEVFVAGNDRLAKSEKLILQSLIAVSEDRHDEAIELLTKPEVANHQDLLALANQNLAVALLYKGEVQKAKSTIESLINDHNSFQTLTINLATILDLTSDRARDMKMSLVSRISAEHTVPNQSRSFTNADFKL